jgi:DNA-binding transcriptional LysR family regulator
LLETDLILICPTGHPVARLDAPRARDLVGWPWAMPSRESNNRIVLESAMRSTGAPDLTAAVEVSADPNGLINLALALGMLTCVPRVALNEHANARDFKVLEVADLALPSIHIGFATTAELRQMPEVADLREAMLDAAKAWIAGSEG